MQYKNAFVQQINSIFVILIAESDSTRNSTKTVPAMR
jgi:hypothetical protein